MRMPSVARVKRVGNGSALGHGAGGSCEEAARGVVVGAAAVLAARSRGLGEGGVGCKDYNSQQAFRPERLLRCWGSQRLHAGSCSALHVSCVHVSWHFFPFAC